MRGHSELDQTTLNLDYQKFEEMFIRFIHMDDLDDIVSLNPGLFDDFKNTLEYALIKAYKCGKGCPGAHPAATGRRSGEHQRRRVPGDSR